MTGAPRVDVRTALADRDLPAWVEVLGFSPDDAADVRAAATDLLDRPDRLAAVQTAADRLVEGVGVLPPGMGHGIWRGLPADADGVLPLLALLATAPVVAAFHASRDVPADISAATLADLGQQTRVHRLVHGGLGLGTHTWEAGYVWSGALYRLGRLQFDLERQATVDGTGEEWVLSTHIPRGERLVPEEVDASLAAAFPFFAAHFGERPASDVHCRSWMLDARIPDLLPGSNLARFQQRWRTYGMPGLGDEDALFFAFARPPETDLKAVPAETSLQRAIASVWRSGNHWLVVDGRLR